MKRTRIQKMIVAFMLVVLFTACGAGKLNKKAEEAATDFYNAIKNKDYNTALTFCSQKAFDADEKEKWINMFERNTGVLGPIQSFTKTNGFNIETSTTTGTTVTMAYDVQWKYGKTRDSLIMIKEGDDLMKVYHYSWKEQEAQYVKEMENSEKMAEKYMSAVESGNYQQALSLCDESAFSSTPRAQWMSFLDRAVNQLGHIDQYKVIGDSTTYHIAGTGDLGKGNYYFVTVQTNRGGSRVMEKMALFQKNYDEPVKLAGHNIL